jgi:hypothetical protein
MEKIFSKIGSFIEECEKNGVQLFFSYSPHVGLLNFNVWTTGKYSEDGDIESRYTIWLEDKNFDQEFESIKSQIKEKYYVKDSL